MVVVDVTHLLIRSASRWTRWAAVAAGVSAAACAIGPNGNGPDPDDSRSGSDVQLTQIDPVEGPRNGGIHAKLTGLHFDDGTHNLSVSFGAAPAVVTAFDDVSADVIVPSSTTLGAVDISVSNGNGTATLPGGFTFTCPTNYSMVAGQCVDFATDSDNCGKAGNVCSMTTACLGGTCTVPAPMPTARYVFGATLGSDGRIYVIGGRVAGIASAIVEVFDPRTNQWTAATPTPTKFTGRAVTGQDGTIHAIAFATPHYAYNKQSDMWSPLAKSPGIPFSAGATVGNDGRIFVLGGIGPNDSTTSLRTSNVYDPGTDTWTALPLMPQTFAARAAATGYGGMIFYFGNPLNVFNPASGTWSTRVRPAHFIEAAATAADNETIYAVGFPNSSGAGLSFYLYNSEKDTWITGPNLSVAHASPHTERPSIVVGRDGRAFVMGGGISSPQVADATRVVEVYDPKRNVWVAGPP